MAIFDDLIKRASQFVEKQKGVWDHAKWQELLTDIQKRGIKFTEETQNYLGLVLESLKKFYTTSTVGKEISENITGRAEHLVSNISRQAATFIEKTRGQWEHLEWEKFVDDIQKKGVHLTEETRSYLGEVLESIKKFYGSLPLPVKEEKKEREVRKATRTGVEEPQEKEAKDPVKKEEAEETKVTGKDKPISSNKEPVKESSVIDPKVTTKVSSSGKKKQGR